MKPIAGSPTCEYHHVGLVLAGRTSRLLALAGPGEILASATTRDLVDGSGLAFEDRGRHELKGIVGAREVFALVT